MPLSLSLGSSVQERHETRLTEEQFLEVLAATNSGRTLDAWGLAQEIGPLESWVGAREMVLASRLVNHLGGSSLSWRLAQQSVRAYPVDARVRLHHFYTLLERRGHFSAWHYLLRLERCPTEVLLEKAEILVSRSDVFLAFRDFGESGRCLAEAQKLAPESPWVWTASCHYWQAQNQNETALTYVDHALALKPWYRPAVQGRAYVLQMLGRDEEALAFLKEAQGQLQFFGISNQLAAIYSEREEWPSLLGAVRDMREKAPLADPGLLAFLAAREADALLGLRDFDGAAEKAAEAGEKLEWYGKLAERLKSVAAPGKRVKIDVPYIPQDYNTCAPATLSAVTAFWKRPIAQDTLIGEICYDGTTAVAERRWIEANGWFCREFKVNWQIATQLLDLGLPVILTTLEIDSGHSQCLIGYDTVRKTLLFRDPNVRHHTEMSYEEFLKHYEPVGPRGVLILPPEQAQRVASIEFPEAGLYDLVYEIVSALEAYDRPLAERALAQLAGIAPNHRHYWTACRALAFYDQNPVQHLDAVDHLRELYPEDDRLIHARIGLLRFLGRNDEARVTLLSREKKRGSTVQLWNDYSEELREERRGTNCILRLAWRRLRYEPQNIAALASFASTLWAGQEKEDSLAVQQLAVSISDKKEQTAGVYFRMLHALGRSQEGIEFLRARAGRLLARSGDPTLTLVGALQQLHRTQEAREVLSAALEQRPKDGALLLCAAELEASAAQSARSGELLEAAAAHTNRLVWLRAAARLQRRAGNQEQALAYWSEVVQTAPLDLDAHREIAILLARRDGRTAGVAHLKELGKRFPQHLGLLQLEIAWLQGHHDSELERRLVEYINANPYNAWAQREFVLFWQRTRPGETNETLLQRAQLAREIDPNNSVSWLVEAGVLGQLGRGAEAVSSIRRALEISVDNGQAQQQLLLLSESEDERKTALAFIHGLLEVQKGASVGFATYREVAFPFLESEELRQQLQDFHRQRPDVWETAKALIAQLISATRLDEAQEVSVAATQRFPLLADAWQQLAVILEHRGDRARSIEFIRFVLELEPELVSAIVKLAENYRHENRTNEALGLLEEAQSRNPLSSILAGCYADNLWRSGRREDAVSAVVRAVDLDPDYQWGWDALSRWSRAVSGKDRAFELCRERAQRLQNDSGAWMQLVRVRNGPGQASAQLDAAMRARNCDAHNANVHDLVALALVRQHRFTEALEACWPKEFSGRNPIYLRGREAWIFAKQGDTAKAIKAMTELLQTNPQYTWGWNELIGFHLQKKDLAAALLACEKLVRLCPLLASSYLRRAGIQLQLKKVPEAKRDLQRAVSLAQLPAAAWRLLRLQLDEHEFTAAEETLRQMEPHLGPGIMMPARMLVAARLNQVDAALDLFAGMATLPEIDSDAINEAIAAIDAIKRGDHLNARLDTLMKHPGLNPYFAALWVARRGEFFNWKLGPQYKMLPTEMKVQSSFLCEWLRQVSKTTFGFETARHIRTNYGDVARGDTGVWGNIGRVLVSTKDYREAAVWLLDWRDRADVEGWMVTNLVYSYHGLWRLKDADRLSREILDRGLRDHTTSIHLCYLAISALEAKQSDVARSLYADIEFQNIRPEQAYIQALIEAAILVQEAATREEKAAVYAVQQARLVDKKPETPLTVLLQAQEKRCFVVMARDASKPLPSTSRTEATPKNRSLLRNLGIGDGYPQLRQPTLLTPARAVVLALITFVTLALLATLGSLSSSAPRPAHPVASIQPTPLSLDLHSHLTPLDQAQQAFDRFDKGEPVPDAMGEMQAAVNLAPWDAKVLCLASELDLRLRNYPDALAFAQRAALASPAYPRALGDLGISLVYLQRVPEARVPIERALEIDPHNALALAADGVFAGQSNNWDQAYELIQQAIKADPQNPVIWDSIKTLYIAAKRLPDGEVKLRGLLQKYPNSEAGWLALGSCYEEENNFASAMEAFEHGNLINPKDYELWNCIGLVFTHKNDLDQAVAAFQHSIRLDPIYAESWNNYGFALAQKGNTSDAIDKFQKALRVDPRHPHVLVNLTNAYIESGDFVNARKTCDILAKVDSKLADSLRPHIQ